MRTGIRLALIPVLVLSLAGCQTLRDWFSTDTDLLPPAELIEFQPSIAFSERWSVDTGDGRAKRLAALRPFLSGGEIWVADHEGQITAVDASSGDIVREFETEMALSAGPAVYEDLLLIGTFDGELVALDRQSGQERWRAPLSSELLSFPILHDGIVVARAIDGRTFGFDRADGARLWVYDRSIPLLTLRGNSDPLARGGEVFIGYDDGTVVSLDVADGVLNWEQRVGIPEGRSELDRLADIDGPMVIVGTDLYVATYADRTAALAVESGRILWVEDLSSFSGLSLQRTTLAAVDGDDTVWLVDRRNGSALWSDDRLLRRDLTRPVFFQDYLIVIDFEGYLHAYDQDSGDFVGRERVLDEAPAAAPLVLGDLLYVLDEDGTLSAWTVSN
jgi:outer membrane protein assembly factor BamB